MPSTRSDEARANITTLFEMTDADDREKAEKLASCFLESTSASLSADLSFNHIV